MKFGWHLECPGARTNDEKGGRVLSSRIGDPRPKASTGPKGPRRRVCGVKGPLVEEGEKTPAPGYSRRCAGLGLPSLAKRTLP